MIKKKKLIVGIDILHIAYWNFYKNIIRLLEKRGDKVIIFVRKRGPLLKVINNEYGLKDNVIVTGRYYSNRKKLFLHPLRILPLIYYILKYKINVTTSDGFFIAAASRIVNVPTLMHSDDYEYRMSFGFSYFFATKMLIPDIFKVDKQKFVRYYGCKEIAYLNDKYYQPNKNVLEELGVKERQYIFIRLIENSSLNYAGYQNQHEVIKEIILKCKESNLKVLVSSEIAFSSSEPNCQILNSPIKDYHSILKYSALVLSEGDTMARESAVLNVPVIYLGGRNMEIHGYFRSSSNFHETQSKNEIIEMIDNINKKSAANQQINETIKFEDINEIVVDQLASLVT